MLVLLSYYFSTSLTYAYFPRLPHGSEEKQVPQDGGGTPIPHLAGDETLNLPLVGSVKLTVPQVGEEEVTVHQVGDVTVRVALQDGRGKKIAHLVGDVKRMVLLVGDVNRTVLLVGDADRMKLLLHRLGSGSQRMRRRHLGNALKKARLHIELHCHRF